MTDNTEKPIVSLVRTEPGKISREDFLKHVALNLDNYETVELTKEEAANISRHINKLSTGSAAIAPMFCGGREQCPFASRCPLALIGKAPVGKSCLIESQLMKEYVIRYFEEYQVDPNSMTEVGYINELAEIEIYLMRLNMNLAKPEYAELWGDQVTNVARDGTPIIQKVISPLAELKEKLYARKSKVVKLMVGDRQEKYKKEAALHIKAEKDSSSKQASMRAKLEALSRQLEEVQRNSAAGEDPQSPPRKILTPEDIISSEDIPIK